MPFSSLQAKLRPVHDSPSREFAGEYRARSCWQLQRILQAGGWTIHDVVNRKEIRWAVMGQWQLTRAIEQDREIEAYISYLEYIEAVKNGVLPVY